MVDIVDAQEEAARAEPPIDPKKPSAASKRNERSHLAYKRVSGLIDAAMLYGQAGDLAAATAILDRLHAVGNALDPAARSRALGGIPAALAMRGLALADGRIVKVINPFATITECTPGPSPIVRPVLDDPGGMWEPKSGTPSRRLKDLVVGALARGDQAQALAIAKGITDPHQCFDALKHYARARARHGDISGALAVAEGLRNDWFRSLIIERIAVARANAADIDGALDSARRIPQPALRFMAFSGVAIALAESGDVAAALAIVEAYLPDLQSSFDLQSGFNPFDARLQIATAVAKSGDATAARKILVALQDTVQRLDCSPMVRGILLVHIGTTYARILDPEGMAGFVLLINRPSERVNFLALLAVELAIAGRREPARRAFAEALGITAAIPEPRERAMADPYLAQAEVALGDIAAARRRVSTRPTSSGQAGVLSEIIKTLCRMGNHGEALRMAAEIASAGSRVQELLFIARSLSGISR
jgi:hypothetical protein